jgi:RimJ/RimL family protein N-acetyltransferase
MGDRRTRRGAHRDIRLENRASIAVAERAGFTRESLLPGFRVKKGRREDRVALSLTASGLWS